MRKPRFINRPDDVTISGNPRKKHRSFNEKEINFLKKSMHLRFAKDKDFSAIQWNFNISFNWKPSIISLKSFYTRKTYAWVWDDMENIPTDNQARRTRNSYEGYEELLKEGLKDPYYGSSAEHFLEFIKEFEINIKVTKSLFNNLRQKFGGITFRTTREESEKIIAYVKEYGGLSPYEVYENLCKDFKMNFHKFNYYYRKAGFKKAITENGYKHWLLKKKASTVAVNCVEIRYEVDGKFFIDKLDVPKKVIDKFIKKVVKSLA